MARGDSGRAASDRSAVDQELRAAALDSVGNAVMVTDAAGTIVWVNPAFTAMSGYAPQEAIGRTPGMLRSGVQTEADYADLWATLLDRRIWRGEFVDRHKDGSHYRVEQTITPILDDHGEITHFVAVQEDVTQLRSSQARLQALFDHALDAIVLFDGDGRLLSANPAVHHLTGHDPDALDQLRVEDLVADTDDEALAQLWDGFRAHGHARGDLTVVTTAGAPLEVEVQAVADITEDVHLLVARDVTRNRRAERDRRFHAQLLEAVGESVIATDLGGRVRYVNPAAERLFGSPAHDMIGRSIAELTVPEEGQGQAEVIMAAVRRGEAWTGRFEVRRSDGSTFPARVTNTPYRDDAGEVAGIIGVATDISDLDARQELLTRRARQQAAVASLGQWALGNDDPRAIANHARDVAAEVLGDAFEVELVWATGPPAGAGFVVGIGNAGALVVAGPGAEGLDVQEREFLRSIGHVVLAAVKQGSTTSQLEHLATHDPVTGLVNRTLFLDRLVQCRAAASRSRDRFAVLFLDLDGFKFINDGLGHDRGDEVLRLVADRLRSALRPGDTVARFGGDEFALLCPDVTTEPEATAVAERVRGALEAGFASSQGTLAVTASIGIVLGDHGTEGAALLRAADTAMYWAKDAGRNRVRVFDDSMQEQARRRFEMTGTIRRALDAGGVEVHYQPTIELATGTIVGGEALVRLRDVDGQLIRPDEFIWVAEETGHIAELGRQVLCIACSDARTWLELDPAFSLSVNLSPRQLTHHDIVETIGPVLRETGVDPSSLWLEITESALLSGPGVHAAMNNLRNLGVRFAIDDFGTGYSSLAHLRRMPVDLLKIDRSFVSGVQGDIQDRALVTASIDLARAFDLPTVAEGVETRAQLAELRDLGCELAQGYLWSPPVAAERFTELLRDGIAG